MKRVIKLVRYSIKAIELYLFYQGGRMNKLYYILSKLNI